MLNVVRKLDGDNQLGAAIARQDAVNSQSIVRRAMFGDVPG
jgi:hypothetical protein